MKANHSNSKENLKAGDIVLSKVRELVLWNLDETMLPTASNGMAKQEEVLIVIQTMSLKEEKIVPRWKTAVEVITHRGTRGWVGVGWLERVKF